MPSEAERVIPLCEPSLKGREREYVDECLSTGWVSSVGKYVDRFEHVFAERHPGTGAVAVGSGTAALHLALLAVGVRPGDEVIVSSLTFIAPANAIRYVGAWPVFLDAEAEHWQMDVQKLEEYLQDNCDQTSAGTINRFTGRRVTAVLPVHILGHPVDMDALEQVATRYGLKVVEDATESLGAMVGNRRVGTIGNVGCFSFNGNKLMTTGGGGMVISQDPEICRSVRYLSTQAKDPGNEYIHQSIGYNYRLTNVQAAIGCAQLERLDEMLARKKEISNLYLKELNNVPGISFQQEAPWARSAWWLFTVVVDEKKFGRSSRELIGYLGEAKITTRPLWQPMHQSPAHSECQRTTNPVAERLFESCVSLPSSVDLSELDQRKVLLAINTAANYTLKYE
jgi:perosamine synthetase